MKLQSLLEGPCTRWGVLLQGALGGAWEGREHAVGVLPRARLRALPPLRHRPKGGRARACALSPAPPCVPSPGGPPGRGGAVGEGRSGTRWVGQVGGVSPGVPRTAEGPPPWAHAAHPAVPMGEHRVWLARHVMRAHHTLHVCMAHIRRGSAQGGEVLSFDSHPPTPCISSRP